MKEDILTILLITVIVAGLDFIVINNLFLKKWQDVVNSIQGIPLKINYTYTIITYILVIMGIYIFVYPKLTKDNWFLDGLKWGFLWGIIVYGIFDFTNLSIFKNYSLDIAIMDTLWGGFLTSATVILTYFILHKM